MGKVVKKEMPMWAKTGHSKPVSRREFLASGLLPFAVSAFVPGALGLLGTPFGAHAATNCPTSSGILPSFITLNLAGGAGLNANFLPRDAGNQLLPSYSKIGGGTAANLVTNNTVMPWNGMGPFLQGSGFLNGLQAGAPTALANTSVIGVCVQSRDDSSENPFDASGMVFKAGLVGSMLPNMGTERTPNGLSNKSAVISPPTPLVVSSVTSINNSIGYTAALRNLSTAQKAQISRLVSSLSTAQAAKLNSLSSTAQVQNLIDCAGLKNNELIAAGGAPALPAALQTVWGVNANTAANNEANVFANMVYHSLAGNGGVVNLQMGGYDYHDGSRNTGNTRDTAAGTAVGRILESAKAMGQKIFVYVTSDGSVTSNDSANPGANWVSDRGTGGLALFFMFDPAARPQTSGLQIGNFTNGQVANDSTFVGSDPAQAAQAVFANYMKFAGRMDLFNRVIPTSAPLSGAVLEGVLRV
ncbi:MAG: hypothetical protein KF799_16195 [Bdellovibrionales bacterium]|nr:hypothetical protein [Bdellovibrionales bacterium]